MRGGRSEGEMFGVKNFEGGAVTGRSQQGHRLNEVPPGVAQRRALS